MDEEDKEYEMMLSNLKYHRITGYVSCNNKSSDKDDKEQVKIMNPQEKKNEELELLKEIKSELSELFNRIDIIEENQEIINSKIDYILRYGKGL